MSAQFNPADAERQPAASSAKMLASKKPAKAKAKVPAYLQSEGAHLSFKSAGSTQWIVLPCIGRTRKFNIGRIVFNEDIIITQKAGGNRCTLRLGKPDYSLQNRRFVSGSAEDEEDRMFVGYFSVTQEMPACCFNTDNGNEGITFASNFPLAKLSSTFTEIRLAVFCFDHKWKQDKGAVVTKPDALRRQLGHLCKSNLSAQPTSTPTPTPSEPVKEGSKKRSLEEIEAEEDEIEEKLRQLGEKRRQLGEERRQLRQG